MSKSLHPSMCAVRWSHLERRTACKPVCFDGPVFVARVGGRGGLRLWSTSFADLACAGLSLAGDELSRSSALVSLAEKCSGFQPTTFWTAQLLRLPV